MSDFLNAQLHKLARDLNAIQKQLGASFNEDREIRDIHDRHMLVSDRHFAEFAHDLKGLCQWEQERQLRVSRLRTIGYLGYRLRNEMAKVQDDGLEAYQR